jgi:hypothetical protein
MNTPGTTTGNWQWRCADYFITDDLAQWLAEQIQLFGRLPVRPENTAARTPDIESKVKSLST